MNLTGLAFRNLGRRPMRTSLSIIGIGLAVGSALALVALSNSIQDSTREGLDELGADLAVTQRGAPDLFGGFLPQDLEQKIAAVPGVVRVFGELFMFAPSEGNKHVLAAGWQADSSFWKTIPMREGRLPGPDEHNVTVIGDGAAETLNKKIGDSVEVLGEQFRIIGIAKYNSVVNRGLVILPLADLQEATFRRGQVTMFHVMMRKGAPEAEVERVRADIAKLGNLAISQTSEVLQNDRNFKTLNAVSLAISIIAMTIGILNVLNTLLMTVQERTREIGIVAAIGWSDRLIIASIVIEGMAMCAAGCVIGVILGYLASYLFRAVPVIGDYLEFKPTLGVILPTVAAAFGLCALGSLYPAWRAVNMTPAEALRRA